jgi:NAD(P)-dependent dehydrogenase (short-subunit alcohol dehydrogenase family)
MSKKTALVTGASRGIGKACAIHLARAGFDVAILARTAREGERSGTPLNSAPLSGDLEATARLVAECGREALPLCTDLLDSAAIGAAAAQLSERWGGVDVIVHAARYVGAGSNDRFADTPIELLQKIMQANLWASLILNKLLIPGMITRGGGAIINITSATGFGDALKPVGQGGWGMSHGITKGAFQRVANFIALEYASQGVRCYNLHPGFTATEQTARNLAGVAIPRSGAPPEVAAAVAVWLATNPEASGFNGQTVIAQQLCHERRLLPGWVGPRFEDQFSGIRYDQAGRMSQDFEERLRNR